MGPGCLEGGVVLLRVEVGVITGRQRPEEVARDLQKKDGNVSDIVSRQGEC